FALLIIVRWLRGFRRVGLAKRVEKFLRCFGTAFPMWFGELYELVFAAAGEIGHVDDTHLACDRGESVVQLPAVIQQYEVGVPQGRDILGTKFLVADCGKPEALNVLGLFLASSDVKPIGPPWRSGHARGEFSPLRTHFVGRDDDDVFRRD